MNTLTFTGLLINREGITLAENICAQIDRADNTLRINSTLHSLEDVRVYATRIESLGGSWTLFL